MLGIPKFETPQKAMPDRTNPTEAGAYELHVVADEDTWKQLIILASHEGFGCCLWGARVGALL